MNNKDKKDLKNYYSDVKLSEKEKNLILNDLHRQLSSQKNNICFVESKRKFFNPAVSVALSVCLITSALSYSKYHHSHDILINNEEKETTPVVTSEAQVTTLWEEIIQSDKITSIPDSDNETSEISLSQSSQPVNENGTEESGIQNTDNTLGSTETAGSIETVQTNVTDETHIDISETEQQTSQIITDITIIIPTITENEPSDEPTITIAPADSSPSITTSKPTTSTAVSSETMIATTAPQYTYTQLTEGTTAAENTYPEYTECTTAPQYTYPIIPSTTMKPDSTEISETTEDYPVETALTTEATTTTTTTTEYYSTTATTTVPPVYEEPITTQPPEEIFY